MPLIGGTFVTESTGVLSAGCPDQGCRRELPRASVQQINAALNRIYKISPLARFSDTDRETKRLANTNTRQQRSSHPRPSNSPVL